MQYKYRWYYALLASAGILAVFLFFDFIPQLDEIKSLRSTQVQSARDLAALPQVREQKSPDLAAHESTAFANVQARQVENFFLLAHKNGINIHALNVLNRKTVSLRGVGEFARWVAFVLQLAEQSDELTLMDFSYELDRHDQLVAKLTVGVGLPRLLSSRGVISAVVRKAPVVPAKNAGTTWRSPFCQVGQMSGFRQPSRAMQLTRFPLVQINQVGYLHQGRRERAIVSLPNGVTLDIGIGDELGSERGKIQAMNAGKVLVKLPKNRVIELRRL